MKLPKSVQADFALLFITVIWASTFAVVKVCLGQASPLLFIALRFWIAALTLAVLLPDALRGISLRTLRQGITLSVLLAGGFILQTLGLRATTPSRCAFITSLFVLFVPLLGFLLVRRRPSIQTLCGITLATAGLGLLTLKPHELGFSPGDVLSLIGAVVFALHILFLGRFLSSSDYRQLVLLQVAGTALLSTLIMPIFEKPHISWDVNLAIYLPLTGVLATALACYIQNSAQRFTTPNRAALVFSLEPFLAAFFSYLLLGEALTGKEWLGGGLILAGIVMSELRRGNRVSSAPPDEKAAPECLPGRDRNEGLLTLYPTCTASAAAAGKGPVAVTPAPRR